MNDKTKKAPMQRNDAEVDHTSSFWVNVRDFTIILLLFFVVKTSVAETYRIPSSSMEDTLLVGDFLIANKFVYGAELPLLGVHLPSVSDPKPGDVIIFLYPGDGITKYIKRCVAGPGDTVLIKNKSLYVNGVRSDDPEHSKYIDRNQEGRTRIIPRGPNNSGSRDNYGPYVVPDGHFFMMGDNRDNSHDSRFWGPVARENIVGKAMLRHWSWDGDVYPSPEVSLADPFSIPRMFAHEAIHFFKKVRWSRVGNLIS